jgi:hypothetical protein
MYCNWLCLAVPGKLPGTMSPFPGRPVIRASGSKSKWWGGSTAAVICKIYLFLFGLLPFCMHRKIFFFFYFSCLDAAE